MYWDSNLDFNMFRKNTHDYIDHVDLTGHKPHLKGF